MDILSDILQLVRLRGTVYFQSDFAGPWGMQMEAGGVAQFHMVVRGQCWLQTATLPEPIALSGGDVVVFPRGAAHTLTDEPGREVVSGPEVLQAHQNGRPLFQGASCATTLICGHFEFDREFHHPLVQNLPNLMHLRGAERYEATRLETVVRLIVDETDQQKPGAVVATDRLAELLFIQILRAYMAQVQLDGYWAALQDREISQALTLIHAQPAAEWSLVGIAQRIGMSRSAFATRFKDLVGVTPMRYITGWRMQKALELLRDTNLPLAAIALRIGYNSQAAFIRAFHREFSQNPGAVRREWG